MENIQQPTTNFEQPMPVSPSCRWVSGVGCWLLDVPRTILLFAIRAYQLAISPVQTLLFGPTASCRFTPGCSQYAMDAVRAHGALAGGALAIRRICRCHPWGGCGHDPVPKKKAVEALKREALKRFRRTPRFSRNDAGAGRRGCDASSQKVDAAPAPREISVTSFSLRAATGDEASPTRSATRTSQPRASRGRVSTAWIRFSASTVQRFNT